MEREPQGVLLNQLAEVQRVRSVLRGYLSDHRGDIAAYNRSVEANRSRQLAGMEQQPLPEISERILVVSAIQRRLDISPDQLALRTNEIGIVTSLLEASVSRRKKARSLYTQPRVVRSMSRSSYLRTPEIGWYDRETKRTQQLAKNMRSAIPKSD